MDKLLPAPAWMLPTSEELKAIEAKNEKLREQYQIKHQYNNQDAAIIIHYQQKEKLARITLQGLIDNDETQKKIDLERRRLAEALLMLGKFKEALEYADNKDDIIRIHRLKYAVEMDDSEVCTCPDSTILVDGQSKPLSRHLQEIRIYSEKHQKMMSVITCSKCLHANATDKRTNEFRAIESARNSGDKKLTDEQVLRRL